MSSEAKGTERTGESALIAHLAQAGYGRAEPAILQPASVFLDLSGEDIRGRLFLTSDASGSEFCMRPEYTIPVARDYLASAKAGDVAGFSYCGPVFRYREFGPSEFVQAGLESFGRADKEAADAEILSLSLEAAAAAGAPALSVKFSDAGLLAQVLEALDLPPVWLRRVKRVLAQGKGLDALQGEPAAANGTDHSGVLAALEGVDKKGARALVEDLLSIAGITAVGGRSAGEIADRFLEQSSLRSGSGFAAEKREILAAFLSIQGDPDQASGALRKLADSTKLNLSAALDAFDARLGFIAARGLDVSSCSFAAGFARNLDYYTGFVFEAHDVTRRDGKPVIGGGRYDRLAKSLGAKCDIPAVGAAIWVERLTQGARA